MKYLNVEVKKKNAQSAIMPRNDQRHWRADGARVIDLQCTGQFKCPCATVKKKENVCQQTELEEQISFSVF